MLAPAKRRLMRLSAAAAGVAYGLIRKIVREPAAAEDRHLVHTALGGLPPPQRRVLELGSWCPIR